jgi:nucleotide-binding universal stress UspA family protein
VPRALAETIALLLLAATLAVAVARPRGLPEAVLVERLVVEAAEGADLLVVARDGDRSRLGPASLGPATRFVVDHAPCPVLLVWPEQTPAVGSIPPRPPHPPRP